MNAPDDIDESRRHFMVSGALFVAFSLAPAARAAAEVVIADEGAAVHVSKATETLAGSLKTNPLLDAWIKIAPDGKVTVFTGKVELGTGVRTALLQIAAEELDMAPSLITFLTADTGASPDEGLTAGSHTIADSGSALLNASAQVRGLLVDAAAQHFGVAGSVLSARNAVIKAPDGRMCYSFGKWVMLQHPNGLNTLYAHLSDNTEVSKGQAVTTGQLIGYSGMTGYATGPHLHFGVYAGAGVKIMDLGTFRGSGGTPCTDAGAVLPVAPNNAYLNPISYLL